MLHNLAESVQGVERGFHWPHISSLGGSYNLMQIATKEILETNGILRRNTCMPFFFDGKKFLLQLSTTSFYSSCYERAWTDGISEMKFERDDRSNRD